MPTITFYAKPNCHLCEDGQWMLEVALKDAPHPVNYVDISNNPALTEKYGLRIPVLTLSEDAPDLGWPFTPESILAWLEEVS